MLIAQGLQKIGTIEAPVAAWEVGTGTGVSAFSGPFLKIINNTLGFLTTLAGLIFLIMLITAGLNWVSSGGDKSKVEASRNQMTNAAIGLIVIIGAYGIAGVVGRVLGLDILNPIKLLEQLNPNLSGTGLPPGPGPQVP